MLELEEFADRGRQLKRTLCQNAGAGRFGLQKELQASAVLLPNNDGNTVTSLIRLSRETDAFSSSPELLAVSIDWIDDLLLTDPQDAGRTGLLLVAARLSWQTGDGNNQAEIDVPAGGTVAVVTAADGLRVDVLRNTGPLAFQGRIIGRVNVGFVGGAAVVPPCTRTIVSTLPMTRALIPRFAKRLSVYPNIFGNTSPPPAGNMVRFFSDITAGSMSEMLTPGSGGAAPVLIPNGALFFDVIGVAATITQSVFELAL